VQCSWVICVCMHSRARSCVLCKYACPRVVLKRTAPTEQQKVPGSILKQTSCLAGCMFSLSVCYVYVCVSTSYQSTVSWMISASHIEHLQLEGVMQEGSRGVTGLVIQIWLTVLFRLHPPSSPPPQTGNTALWWLIKGAQEGWKVL